MVEHDNKVKQNAIAAEVGVSVSTVSRALASSPSVGAETRARILKAAEAMGYDLSQGNTPERAGAIVICPARFLSGLTGYYYLSFLQGIRQELKQRRRRVELQVISVGNETENEALLTQALQKNPDIGCILLGQPATDYAHIMNAHGRHHVLLNAEPPVHPTDVFSPDSRAGGSAAADHLLEMGHRTFCSFAFPTTSSMLMLREKGFHDRLLEKGIPEADIKTVIMGSNDPDVYEAEFIAHFNETRDRQTGLFCINDIVAMGVWSGLRQAGLKVPEDVAIVGFDNSPHGEMIHGGFTTLDVPCEQIGSEAAKQLLARKEDPDLPYRTVLFQPKLIKRGSTAAQFKSK